MPNGLLKQMAANPSVFKLQYDRPIETHNYRTAVTVGARTVQDISGYTGAGIGIAVIDSGISTWHDDLTNNTSKLFPYGNQRVDKFVDFVNGRTLPYDDNGHGTHVAGIIAGNGYDSYGEKRGIAPDVEHHLAEGARPERPGHHQQHHRGPRLGGEEREDLQHPRRQHVGRRGDSRIRTGPTR